MSELARCPCGKIPKALFLMDTGQGGKYVNAMGGCCGEWSVEFKTSYHPIGSEKCMELAIDEWNRAPRAFN
jgi:hypothetical protein